MVRTQVYLTKTERDELAALADATGKKQSELIRQAVDNLLEQSADSRRQAIIDAAAGMWKDRDDLPDFRALRKEWNRER
jgi:metal-responsive CopG/Arc/MetJ family transcriptional regulator